MRPVKEQLFDVSLVIGLGTQFHEGEPVYPEGNFVDAFSHAPLHNLRDKKPPYVFVWKTWGKNKL